MVKALRFKIFRHALWVTDGKRQAPVGGASATMFEGVKRRHSAKAGWQLSVTYVDEDSCSMHEYEVEFPARVLMARLENAAALTRHRRKDFQTAAQGFARATALDPEFDVAWSNLASAYALLGERERALDALAPLIRRNAVRTYYKVNIDPELASLRDAPALVALHAPQPGTASLAVQGGSVTRFDVAFSTTTNTIAVVRSEGNLGCGITDELLFFDAATGEERSRFVLVQWEETEYDCDKDGYISPKHRGRVEARIVAANRTLANLGFSVSPACEQVLMPEKRDALVKAYFPQAGLGLVTRDHTARVLRGDDVLGLARELPYRTPDRATYDPLARAVIFRWLGSFPEGCNSEHDEAGITVIPVRQ